VRLIAEAGGKAEYISSREECGKRIVEIARPGDRIAVMGAGGVGGYFGARLAQAGHEVAFVARGRQLEALRAHGLRMQSSLGDAHLPDVRVTDEPTGIGTVDLVLFSVKLWDTLAAAKAVKPLLGEKTAVVSFQPTATTLRFPAVCAAAYFTASDETGF